jgi:antitoxin component of MazEF toxin-antitoxin module
MLQTTAVISEWGNSQAVRLPSEMIRQLGIQTNDEVVLQVIDDTLPLQSLRYLRYHQCREKGLSNIFLRIIWVNHFKRSSLIQ